MTSAEIIRMAREAGWGTVVSMPHIQALERFAALVAAAERTAMMDRCRDIIVQSEERGAAAEREACATIDVTPLNILASDGPGTVILKYQAAIRSRGQA